MGIPQDIRASKQAIAERWEREVLREVPALQQLERGALIDHMPEFLDGLAAWIEGKEAEARRGFEALADGHALQRHALGIDLETLTDEYAVLRRVILEMLIERSKATDLAEATVRLAAGIDRAVAGAVKRYASARDHVRERFIGILAHDLRDPLSAVMMSATLLADVVQSEKQTQLVERITRGARRIERMIDDVLDFARGRLSGSIPVTPRLADMKQIAEAAVDESRAAGAERPVRIEHSGDLRGHWDPDRVRQALANLLANARAYGRGEIVVRVHQREDNKAVVTSVTNTGPTIPADQLKRIFDPYARAQTIANRGGLGLGLYIVDQIARAHGGLIRAESAEGTTTFTIEWPRIPVDETPGRPT